MTTARLTGLGAYVPPRIVTNDELSTTLDTSDEWIRTRTGIRERHIIDPGTSTSDLATEAGRRALTNAGLSSVDTLILATTTPDHPCPATAPHVAARLSLGTIPAFDLAAVCSGFIYALHSAASMIRSGSADRVLVIGAETFTSILDPQDRGTRPIFGDGAGAVTVERSDDTNSGGALLDFDLGSDGSLVDLIAIPGGGSKDRASSAGSADPYFRMQGPSVFRAAVTKMTESSRAVMNRSSWRPEDVDWLVAHQANVRIIETVGTDLSIASDRAVINLDLVGNTSAASIPLALADHASRGMFTPGDKVLLTAFGGGVTWGSASLLWPTLAPVDQVLDRTPELTTADHADTALLTH